MSRALRDNPPVTLMYAGWQVWDAPYGVIRVGETFSAAVEFVQRSTLREAGPDHRVGMRHVADNVYVATARVLHTTEVVVLDLGSVRAIRWVRPGEGSGGFEPGGVVALELSLGLNAWDQSSWTEWASDHYGTNHEWLVERILRKDTNGNEAMEIAEASIKTVDSVGQYCLLDCQLNR